MLKSTTARQLRRRPTAHRRSRQIGRVAAALLAGTLSTVVPAAAHAVEGFPVRPGSLRFVAEVRTDGTVCTGSLIHPSWVLTAEHCSHPTSLSQMSVRIGNNTRSTGGEFRRITRIVRHPEYKGGHNDLALLELSTPVTNITPVRLATPDFSARWDGVAPGGFATSDEGEAVGWGQVRGGTLPAQLQHKVVAIEPPRQDGHDIKMIPVDRGPCPGDSGGPLLVNWNGEQLQVGALKGAPKVCGERGGSYSEVGAGTNRDWIFRTVTKLPFTSFGVADWDRDGHQDIITRHDASGDLFLYPGASVRGYASQPRVRIGEGWNGFTPFGVADWDRDGHQDIITRNDTTGQLWLYRGQSVRGYSPAPRVLIGYDWNGHSPFGVGDWDRDGHQDIIARNDNNGELWLWAGQSVRGYVGFPGVRLATGWNHYGAFDVADYDRDGSQDIIARDNGTGTLWLHAGQGVRAPLSGSRVTSTGEIRLTASIPPVSMGGGWTAWSSFGVADWDGDGHEDILTRDDSTGLLHVGPGRSVRSYAGGPWIRIGEGW